MDESELEKSSNDLVDCFFEDFICKYAESQELNIEQVCKNILNKTIKILMHSLESNIEERKNENTIKQYTEFSMFQLLANELNEEGFDRLNVEFQMPEFESLPSLHFSTFHDPVTEHILVFESGSTYSLAPVTKMKLDKCKPPNCPSSFIETIQGAIIPTFGTQQFNVHFDKKEFLEWRFHLVPINFFILGADFLSHYNIEIGLNGVVLYRSSRFLENETDGLDDIEEYEKKLRQRNQI